MFDFSKSQRFFKRIVAVCERHIKVPVFDCSMCGQCVLRSTGMVCPMRCPKQMRNGPCGGAMDGKCEVFRERPCVWDLAYKRMEKTGMTGERETIQPPVDWRLWGTSAWLNLCEKKIDKKGHAIQEATKEAAR